MWYLADEQVTLGFDYKVDGFPVAPESARIVLKDRRGVSLVSEDLPAQGTSETYTIPSIHNGIVLPYEARFARVSFIYDGQLHAFNVPYWLHEFLPINVTPEKVRALIGLDAQELPDQDIPLVEAYYDLSETSDAPVAEALLEGGRTSRKANEAVAIKAALLLLPSVELRIRQNVRTEDSTVTRLARIDLARLRAELEDQLANTLGAISVTTEVAFVPFALSNPEDPFSG